ncbi:hypothetical protein HY440_01890 [Candidatus Microgenomates bacterium]|nr:hypothetical protein [Candidatus Microgenomates bacterium]
MTYLEWIAIFWGIPIAAFLLLDFKIFVRFKHIFFKILVGILMFGYVAEIIALSTGLWSFPKGLSGVFLFTIPIEEYLWTGLYAVIPIFLTLFFLERKKLWC